MAALPSTFTSESKSRPNEPNFPWLGVSLAAATATAALVIPGALYLRRKKNVKFPPRSVAPRRQREASGSLKSLPTASPSRVMSPIQPSPNSLSRTRNSSAETGGVSLRRDDFSPMLHAIKALGIATLLVSVGGLASIWVVKTAMDVEDTQEFTQKMRLFILTRMPALSSRIHRVFDEDSDKPGDRRSDADLANWSWEDAEKRLQSALDKEGVMAWAEVALKELQAEEHVERMKRKELEDASRRKH